MSVCHVVSIPCPAYDVLYAFLFQNLTVHMTLAFCRSSDDYDDSLLFAVPIW